MVVSCPSCKAQIRRYDKQQTDIRQITASNRQLSRLLAYVKGVDFVTLNERIGVPKKRKDMTGQLWDYQLDIANRLQDSKYLWILKAVGLGITECCLRWILYKAMTSDEWTGKQVPIIVGPNINLATKLIKRIRRIFENHNIFFDTKETFVVINGVEIECFPSHHLDAVRSLESPACIYISEADFFPIGQQSEVRQVSERYITKSNPHIIMESTANAPGGLFDTMSNEQDSIYTKLYLDYTLD